MAKTRVKADKQDAGSGERSRPGLASRPDLGEESREAGARTSQLGSTRIVQLPHDLVPRAMFFTNGSGTHRDKLSSFELALREAGVATANLVSVSSIFPPHCKVIPRNQGIKLIRPGQVVFAVMTRQSTSEPHRLIAASIGLARPTNPEAHGYLSEHDSFGETKQKAGDYAEDLAASMLATTLGLAFDPDRAWDERKEVFRMSGQIVHTSSTTRTATGHKKGLWTTVVALGVFIL
jgi:arginine decarboxylase